MINNVHFLLEFFALSEFSAINMQHVCNKIKINIIVMPNMMKSCSKEKDL